MTKFIYLYLLLITISTCVNAQKISGTIENKFGEKIASANVTTKQSINSRNIEEFVISKNGVYTLTLLKIYKQVVIEVSASNYQKVTFIIDSFVSTKNYVHNFILINDTAKKLEEVIVKAKIRPFQIKDDTVKYNVSSYKDGTERKIQDIIKRLPGIVVNEKTGEIRYKGKSVETVKLDGDDLFASNYTIGTKNINVDMVEQVQAIENYSDNPLLKGIESGDKVALNLTLKKKKADYSGSIDLGVGVLGKNPALDLSTNILGISKKYKSFITSSYNNVGINNTPFDYFSYNPNVEQLRESDLTAKKYISDIYFDTEIDANRSNINSSFFSSYNAVFKIGKKLSLKSNIYYLNDKLKSQQINISTNSISGQEFTTSDKYSLIKKPNQIRGDMEAKYNVSKKSLLEYSVQYKSENINTSNNIIQNDITSFNTILSTKDNYFKQSITYTNKVSQKNALQIIVKHTFNTIPQQFGLLPAIVEPLKYNINNQMSWYKKSNLLIQTNLLGSNSKGKYALSLGFNFRKINFNSDLIGTNGNTDSSINGFSNNSNYTQKNIYLNGNYKFQLKRFRLTPAITVSSLHQNLSDKVSVKTKETSNILIEPNFSVAYKLNSYSSLLISAGIKQKPFTEDNFVENPVYISNRIIKANEIKLQIQQSKSVGLFYLINNLYKQFQLSIGANYSENKGNYFSNLFIQQNSTKSVNFFLPENNRLFLFNFMIEKYIPFLQGTLRYKNDFSRQLYKNIINNSPLRNNTNESLSNIFFFKTALDGKINFENTIQHKILKSKTEGGLQFNNNSFDNNFQIIIRPKKRIFLLFSTDYFLPNTAKKKQSYLFFDTDITYQTKNKIYDLRFKARNITNNKNLNQFDTNDYSTNYYQTNLLPRHLIISVSRNF